MSGLSTNIFAALQKKKSIKKPSTKEDVKEEPKVDKHAEIEKAIFSGPSTTISNWADDSEDEWDAPAQVPAAEEGWNQATKGLSSSRSQARMAEIQGDDGNDSEESDGEDYHEDIHLDIEAELGIELPRSDDEDEDEESEEEEEELPGAAEEATAAAKPAAPVQLSKKEKEELKKKELQDLDAVLAELGLEAAPKDDSAAAVPSGKAAKRKAKKKTGGEALATAATPEPEPEATNGTSEETLSGPAVDPDAIKAAKAALAKKKGSSKKLSAAAEAAAAAAAKAKAKKAAGKDKSKYNEMPTR